MLNGPIEPSDIDIGYFVQRKIYVSKDSFRDHMKRVHDPNAKKFKCDLCEKLFTTNWVLKKHGLDVHGTTSISK